MKIETRPAYYLTLLLLLCVVSGCTKASRATRAIATADSDVSAGRYDHAEINYLKALQLAGRESALTGEVFAKLGRVYFAQGRWHKAALLLMRNTNDIPSKVMLNESLFFMGYPQEAFSESAALLKVQPGHPEAMLLLTDSAGTDVANLTNAASILNQQPERAKATAAYRAAQGTLLLRSNNLDAAEKEYQAALDFDPKFYRAHLGLAHTHSSRKDPDKAKAKAEVRAAIAALPNRSGAISACLITLYLLGEKTEAMDAATAMTTKSPDFIPPYVFLASSAFEEGNALEEGKETKKARYDASLSFLKKPLEKDPGNSSTLTFCGDVFLAQGDRTNALAYYQRAQDALNKPPPLLLLKMGRAHLANSDTTRAKATFWQAVDVNTNLVPEAVLTLSQLAILQSDAREATKLTPNLKKLTTEQPQLLVGYTMLANLYLTQSETNNAIKVMQDAQNRFTNVAELPYLAGKIYKSSGQRPKAREAFEQALKLAPQSVMALSAVVDLDVEENLFTNAYNRISMGLTNSPDSAPLHYLRGRVFWREAQTSDGIAGAEQETKINGAIDSFTKAIQLSPTNQESYYSLADVYTKTGRHKEALEKLQNYLSNTNMGGGSIISNAPGAYLLTAQIYERIRNYTNAAGYYEKIVAMNQRNITTLIALNNLACLYNDHLDKVEEAYRLAQSAREMAPRVPSIAETLGWVVFNKGDYSRALALLHEAAADPQLAEKPDYLYHVGMANYMMGAEEDAREALHKALAAVDGKTNSAKMSSLSKAATESTPSWVENAKSKLSNLAPDATAADSGLNQELQKRLTATPGDPILLKRLGMVQERRGEYPKALESFEAALKSNPKHIDIRLRIALLYAGPMNDLTRGLALAKKVKDDAPNDPKAAFVVGQLAYRSGEYRLAVALLEESADNYPDDAVLNYYLGAARYSVGRVLDAEQPMRKAAKSGAAVPQVADAIQFLSFISATKEPGMHPETVKLAAELARVTNSLPALMLIAVDSEHRTNYQGAVESYSRILKDYPAFHPAARNLGLLYFSNTKDREKAYDPLNKVREQYSEDAVFRRALGIMACQRGDYDRAILLLQSNRGEPATGPEATLFYLGKAQFKLKKREARETLQLAVKGDLPKDLEQECQKMLDSLN